MVKFFFSGCSCGLPVHTIELSLCLSYCDRKKDSAMRFFEALKNNLESIFSNVIPYMVWHLHHQRWKPKNIKFFWHFCVNKSKVAKVCLHWWPVQGVYPASLPYASWDRLQQTHDPERIRGREDRCLHLKVCIRYEYLYVCSQWSTSHHIGYTEKVVGPVRRQPWTSVLVVMLVLASELSAVADIYLVCYKDATNQSVYKSLLPVVTVNVRDSM